MGISGFVFEILVPGLLAVFAGILLAWEWGFVPETGAPDYAGAVLLSAILVVAYLVGVALRPLATSLVDPPPVIYRDHLQGDWADHYRPLADRWLDVSADRGDLSVLSPERANELIARLSQYGSATYSDAWTERLLYHRNLARLSANSLPPMVLLVAALLTGLVHRGVAGEVSGALLYLVGVGCTVAVGFSLRRVYVSRFCRYVDALIRTDLAVQRREPRRGS